MPRLKDINWTTVKIENGDGSWSASLDDRLASLLMDIRDELKDLNRETKLVRARLNRLDCPDFVRIPSDLRKIRLNTTKKRRPKKSQPSSPSAPLR